MQKITKMQNEDLEFVRKYCLAGTFPASDERCPYAKAKLLAGVPDIPKGASDLREADALFLCRYPDQKMPTHEARLISELSQCPHTQRREMIDGMGVAKV
ncbi:MAG: hypothetical protein LJE87_09800 [Deltaproteobacteria bacterium]|jgi:hypothetical protein|nr:hypothetical protein [Deltaproteobacteria bacterium]